MSRELPSTDPARYSIWPFLSTLEGPAYEAWMVRLIIWLWLFRGLTVFMDWLSP